MVVYETMGTCKRPRTPSTYSRRTFFSFFSALALYVFVVIWHFFVALHLIVIIFVVIFCLFIVVLSAFVVVLCL